MLLTFRIILTTGADTAEGTKIHTTTLPLGPHPTPHTENTARHGTRGNSLPLPPNSTLMRREKKKEKERIEKTRRDTPAKHQPPTQLHYRQSWKNPRNFP
jgi:hypothetical protein